MKTVYLAVLAALALPVFADNHLPPVAAWQGASESLIQPTHPWVTPAELTGLTDSPDYQSTMTYLKKLVESAPALRLEVLGQSPQGRDIVLVKASQQPDLIGRSGRPTLLVQAGIHSGEIDGKDAGLMLLRDIVHGDKAGLLNNVHLIGQ